MSLLAICFHALTLCVKVSLALFNNMLCAGNFIAASKLLCSLSNKIEDTYSHVIFLRCLADAGEMQIAIKHIKWVEDTSPSKLQAISTELFGSLSSSSLEPQQILSLLQAMQNNVKFSRRNCATDYD